MHLISDLIFIETCINLSSMHRILRFDFTEQKVCVWIDHQITPIQILRSKANCEKDDKQDRVSTLVEIHTLFTWKKNPNSALYYYLIRDRPRGRLSAKLEREACALSRFLARLQNRLYGTKDNPQLQSPTSFSI